MATDNTNLISVLQHIMDSRANTATKEELVALRALVDHLLMSNQSGLDTEVQADINALTNTSAIADVIKVGMAATFLKKKTAGHLGKFMPVNICRGSDLYLKTNQSSTVNSINAQFWSNGFNNVNAKHSDYTPYAKTDTVDNNVEQQIVNIPVGKGVLTHVITPECHTSPTIKIRVVADGEEYIFVTNSVPQGNGRLCLGGILDEFASTNGSASGAGIGSFFDAGFNANTKLAIKPNQAIQKGIGLTFEKSLEVYFQCVTGGLNMSSEYRNAYAVVANNIPLGFEK